MKTALRQISRPNIKRYCLIFFLITSTFLSAMGARIASMNKATETHINKVKTIRPDLPGTIDGSVNPAGIPDSIAYELFLRVLGKHDSTAFARRVGLND